MKILIVDDDVPCGLLYTKSLEDKFQVLVATNQLDATEMFDENSTDLVAIIMDGCLTPGVEVPDTIEFVEYILSTKYKGLLVANSATHNDVLVKAGCKHRCENKWSLPSQLTRLLAIE